MILKGKTKVAMGILFLLGKSNMPAWKMAGKLNVSTSYVEQIMNSLVKNGLVKGTRGPKGGYKLSKPLCTISVTDVADAVEFKPSSKTDLVIKSFLSNLKLSDYRFNEVQ